MFVKKVQGLWEHSQPCEPSQVHRISGMVEHMSVQTRKPEIDGAPLCELKGAMSVSEVDEKSIRG